MVSRVDRVRKTLMKELSDIIHRNVKDPRISGVVSITDIELSQDCRYAKVYISVYGSEEQQSNTMEALQDSAHLMQSLVNKRIRLRYTPELEFKMDNSLERGTRLTELLNKISKGEL